MPLGKALSPLLLLYASRASSRGLEQQSPLQPLLALCLVEGKVGIEQQSPLFLSLLYASRASRGSRATDVAE